MCEAPTYSDLWLLELEVNSSRLDGKSPDFFRPMITESSAESTMGWLIMMFGESGRPCGGRKSSEVFVSVVRPKKIILDIFF